MSKKSKKEKKSKKAKKRSKKIRQSPEADGLVAKKPRSSNLKPTVHSSVDSTQIPNLKAADIDLEKSVSEPNFVLKERLDNLKNNVAKANNPDSVSANVTQIRLLDQNLLINELNDKVSKLTEENKTLLEQLRSVKESSEKLKSGLVCAVCLDHYHLPHNLECGHTFCFSCIRSWLAKLVATGEKLCCPLCRVKVEKVPSFVRPLHNQLLETLELEKGKYSALLASIKNHLQSFENESKKWQDIFPDCGFRTTIWDGDDDVARCTTCNWEVVGKHCANCGAAYSGESESERSNSNTSDSGESIMHSGGSDSDQKSEDDEQEESDSTLDSFVCQDDEVEYESDCSSKDSGSRDAVDSDDSSLSNSEVEQSDKELDSEPDSSSSAAHKPRARQLVVSDSE